MRYLTTTSCRLLWAACIVCLGGILAPAQSSTRETLERSARELEELTPSDYLWERVPAEIAALAGLPRREVEAAVGHPDPRVRALALGVLALRGDPRSLPVMVAVAFDEAPAPPAREPHARAILMPGGGIGAAWTPRPQTVGEIATTLVGAYLSAAGFHYGIEGRRDHPGFAGYWRERRERAHCLSWFELALDRASQGTLPMPASRRPHVAALRHRIDALAPPYRDWVLLALAAPWETGLRESGTEALATEADLLQAAKNLGRARLLGLLRGEAVLPDDPDFRYGDQGPLQLQRVVPFLLRHAGELLEPARSGELRRIGYLHLDGQPVGESPRLVTARWFTAAADLDPVRAVPILLQALGQLRGYSGHDGQDHRATIVAELWRHAGDRELARILDWFFAEEPLRGAFGFGRHRFASSLTGPSRLALLRAILLDPRLAELDWQTLRRLAEAVNAVAERPVVSRGALDAARHPRGEGHYHWERERARAEHPAATAALEAILMQWRQALVGWARGHG